MIKEYPIVPDDYDGPGDPAPPSEEGDAGTVEGDAFAAPTEGTKPRPIVAASETGRRMLDLVHPPKVDGKPLRRVTVRLLEQGDVDDWVDGVITTRRELVLRLTGLHGDVIRKLKWPDSEALHLIIQDLLPDFIVSSEAFK